MNTAVIRPPKLQLDAPFSSDRAEPSVWKSHLCELCTWWRTVLGTGILGNSQEALKLPSALRVVKTCVREDSAGGLAPGGGPLGSRHCCWTNIPGSWGR